MTTSLASQPQASNTWTTRELIRRRAGRLAPLPPAFFLTDPDRVEDPETVIVRLPPGVGVIYRHFGRPDRFSTAETLHRACSYAGRYLLVAADPDLATAIGADGVHWPERLRHRAKQFDGKFAIQTGSSHSFSSSRTASRDGLDAVLRSAVFPSRSPSAGPPIGIMRLRREAAACSVPVYALGGVNYSNARRLPDFVGLSGIDLFLR